MKKKKLIIGVDIDDTIAKTEEYIFEKAIEYDKTIRNKGVFKPYEYYICKRFDWNEKEQMEFISQYNEFAKDLEPKENVRKVFEKIKENGHTIILITTRNNIVYHEPDKICEEWMQKHNIPYDKLYTNAIQKDIICMNENIDIFVDDKPRNCENVFNSCAKTEILLFDSKINKDENRFKRVYSWLEIEKIIDEMSGTND